MTDASSSFVYVTFIRTTPERLWEALTTPEFTRRYWFGMHQETDWTPGSPWRLVGTDGRIRDAGEVLAADRPRLIRLRWRHEMRPELKAEGYSECTIELEPMGEAVKLTVDHRIAHADSALIGAVSGGWPRILSNLKSLLETGEVALAA